MRFRDVLPETRGTPLGKVVLGEENADFFVFGEEEPVPGDQGEDAGKTVVVFKTWERHPVKRVARRVGTPVRVVRTTVYTVFGKIAGWLTFWKPKKEQASEPPSPAMASVSMGTPVAALAPAVPSSAIVPHEEKISPAPVWNETERTEFREEQPLPRESTAPLNWAGPIGPALYGKSPQTIQTGG